MLIDFTVGNFKSFKDEMTLSMEKLPGVGPEDNYFINGNKEYLKTAAIFGANASGKSNLIKAMTLFKRFIRESNKFRENDDIEQYQPFRLSENSLNEPSHYEITLAYNEMIYQYGFKLDGHNIHEEWLKQKRIGEGRRTQKLFSRNGKHFQLHQDFKKAKDLIDNGSLRNDALLISIAPERNIESAISFLKAIGTINIVSGISSRGFMSFTKKMLQQNESKKALLNLLSRFDLGFDDIIIEDIAEEEKKRFQELASEIFNIDNIPLKQDFSNFTTIHEMNDDGLLNKKRVKFNLERDESEGTKRMVYFSGPMQDTLENGLTLVIDEFEARLHPEITREIVRIFNSPIDNPKNAQLIFITHDVNLLNSSIMRRDQIWFTEKNKEHATELYSLADFDSKKVRNDYDFRKRYLQGMFGAVPYIPKVHERF